MNSIFGQQGTVGFVPFTLQDGKNTLLRSGQILNVSDGIGTAGDLALKAGLINAGAINVFSQLKGYSAVTSGTLNFLLDQVTGAVQATGNLSVRDAISNGTDLGLLEVLKDQSGSALGAQLTVQSVASSNVKAVLSASSTLAALNMYNQDGVKTVSIDNSGAFLLGNATAGAGSSSTTLSDTSIIITASSTLSFAYNSDGSGNVQLNGGKFYVDSSHLSATANNELVTKQYADDIVAAEAAARDSAVNAEAARASAAESALSAALAQEVLDRAAAVAQEAADRSTAVAAEESARMAADSVLSAALAQEVLDRAAAEASILSSMEAMGITDLSILTQDVSDLSSAIAAEGARASAAESELSSGLAQEIADRTAAVAQEAADRSTAVAAEEAARMAADSVLSAALAQEVLDRAAAVSEESSLRSAAVAGLSSDLAAEVSRAQASEDSILSIMNAMNLSDLSTLNADVSDLSSAIAAEEAARMAADSVLSAALAQEVLDRAAAVAQEASDRSAAVAAEEAARMAADSVLSAALAQEVADRTAAVSEESSLRSAAVAAEEAARMAADSVLSAALAQEVSDRTAAVAAEADARMAADSVLSAALAQEVLDRTAAVAQEASDRSTAVAAEEAARMAADSVLSAALAQEVADRNTAVSEESSLRSAAIASEIARATAAEADLMSAISSEAGRATAAEASIMAYVDLSVQGYSPKVPVDVATTGNVDLTASVSTIDGVDLASINASTIRVLVRAQSNSAQNGIYDFTAGAGFVRAADADTAAKIQRALVTVQQGDQFGGNTFFLVVADSVIASDPTLLSTSLEWHKINAPGDLSAGNGIDKTGNVISMNIRDEGSAPALWKTIDFDAGKAFVNSLLAGFKVANVATDLTVTADNLSRLTNGSFVDVDSGNSNGHLHTRLTSSVDVSAVGEGYAAHMSTDGAAQNAATDSSVGASVVGVKFQGKLVTSGEVKAAFDMPAGVVPAAGDQVFLASSGKLTTVCPGADAYRVALGWVVNASSFSTDSTVLVNLAIGEPLAL